MLAVNMEGDIFAATYESFLKSVDKGKSWVLLDTSLAIFRRYTAILTFSDSILFLGTDQNGLFISYNGGSNWSKSHFYRSHIESIIKDENNQIILATSAGHYISPDTGRSWTQMSDNLGWIRWLTINTRGIILAGTSDARSSELFEVYRCKDIDFNWEKVNPDSSDHIELVPSNGNTLFINTKYGLRCSIDDGLSWSMPNSSAPQHPNNIIETKVGNYFVSDEFGGVYQSSDNGVSWHKTNTGLSAQIINCLVFHPDGHLYLATNSGLFKTVNQIK
jgi:ligand-binding sensor domain-containing protein